MPHMYWPDGGYGGFWMLFNFLFWILVVVGIILLVRYLARPRGPEIREETPLGILKKRYARGEITKDEFEQMKKDIS